MALTKEERLNLLYNGQQRPDPVSVDPYVLGLASRPFDPSRLPNFTEPNKRQPEGADQNLSTTKKTTSTAQQTTYNTDDDNEEDEYILACMASAKSKNAIQAPPSTRSGKKKNTIAGAESSQTQAKGKDKCDYSTAIPQNDALGNKIVSQFCSLALVAVYPYKFISKDIADKVAKRYFDQGKIWKQDWELYYIHLPGYLYSKPILLVAFSQFQAFIDKINNHYKSSLVIPTDPDLGFTVIFYNDNTPQPIYLGRARDRDHITTMTDDIPNPKKGYGETPVGACEKVDQSFSAFKKKMETVADAAKRKNKAVKKRRTQDRVAQQQDWCRSLKRAQRYLGLRPRIKASNTIKQTGTLSWSDQQSAEREEAVANGRRLKVLDVTQPVAYSFESQPIIIAIDVESNERNHRQVTELGVSTLDTMDLEDVPPGEDGVYWKALIRSRHFRIAERAHHVNRDFCAGDPTKFQFGISEFLPIAEAGRGFDECFQWPFSYGFSTSQADTGTAASSRPLDVGTDADLHSRDSVGSEASVEESKIQGLRAGQKGPKQRLIVLVGHDLKSDLSYLRLIESSIISGSRNGPDGHSIFYTILEALDTSDMYKVLIRDNQAKSLGNILMDLGIAGWYLHNAGNDARYTLEAFITTTIKSRFQEDKEMTMTEEEKQAAGKFWMDEVQSRIDQKCQEAEEQVRVDIAIWAASTGTASEEAKATRKVNNVSGSNSTAPSWYPDMDAYIQNDSIIDGGEPSGWQEVDETPPKPNQSKKAASARRREAEEWFNNYMKQQEAESSTAHEASTSKGNGDAKGITKAKNVKNVAGGDDGGDGEPWVL